MTRDQGQSPVKSEPAVVNVAAYKFVTLDELQDRRRELKSLCQRLDLKGTILLASEGINLFIAGSRDSMDQFLVTLRSDPAFTDLTVKESVSDEMPFNRMLVKLKKEIIAFGLDGIEPAKHTAPKISPAHLKQWLDEGKPLTLLDTRNEFEVELGTFHNAVDLNIGHFRDFPRAVKSLSPELKEQPVVMFCTGGIRCEKAGPLMQREGFQQVYQLNGGILKYFEDCGGEHWDGECFVFDRRVAVDADLEETGTEQCFVCQALLTPEDQTSEKYVFGQSCPRCFVDPRELMRQSIEQRHRRIRELTNPLPGSLAYDNQRPLNVPERFDRATLLDCLDGLHPHIGRATWRQKCEDGRIDYRGEPAAYDKIVRAGERYVHLLPATTEPDVNADIRILYEDDFLVVVNKPAPLPVHASGRFNRNTLMYVLHQIYQPRKLRPVHRLDANTSGVMVFSRTRSVATELQQQFKSREIIKTYVARVQGQPEADQFVCDTAISAEASQAGIRLPDPHGLESVTEFEVIRRLADRTALLRARPLSGRTNQIRLHLWDLEMPACGDPAYLAGRQLGASQTLTPACQPLCLHAHELTLRHPESRELVTFTADLPGWATRDYRAVQPPSTVTKLPIM